MLPLPSNLPPPPPPSSSSAPTVQLENGDEDYGEEEDEEDEYMVAEVNPADMLAMSMGEQDYDDNGEGDDSFYLNDGEDNDEEGPSASRGSSPEVVAVMRRDEDGDLEDIPLQRVLGFQPKRGRGRPRKHPIMPGVPVGMPTRGRGRGRGRPRGRPRMPAMPMEPYTMPMPTDPSSSPPPRGFKRGRGRPRREDYMVGEDGEVTLLGSNNKRLRNAALQPYYDQGEVSLSGGGSGGSSRGGRVGGRGKCTFCSAPVASPAHFWAHVGERHSRRMRCPSCYFSTPFRTVMDNHCFSKHGAGERRQPLRCPFCTYRVYQWGRLSDHISAHGGGEGGGEGGGGPPAQSGDDSLVESGFAYGLAEEDMEVQMPDMDPWQRGFGGGGGGVIAGGGGVRLVKRQQQQQPRGGGRKRVYGTSSYERTICSLCETRFCSSSDLRAHLNAVHFCSPPPYACPHPGCEYSTTSKFNLPQHFDICHRRINDYHCPHCEFVTFARPYLRTHEKAVHEAPQEEEVDKVKRARPGPSSSSPQISGGMLKCTHCDFKANTR